MRFIIFVSVLICLFTIVLFKRFEKKIPSFGLRCLYDLVGFILAITLMGLFQLEFLGEAVTSSSHKITSDYLLKLGVFFFIVYKFLNYKNKHEISEEKVSAFHYVIAALSFIPLIGILIGLITTIFGFFTKKKGGGIVAVIGVSGIVFMFFLKDIGFLKVLDQNQATVIFDGLKQNDAVVFELNHTLDFLESVREQYGAYPPFLENINTSINLHYELIDLEHYYLLEPGKDKIPFTADDILPSNVDNSKRKTGFLIKNID